MKAIILAAGEGRRMKSDKPKVLHKILNKPLLNYVIGAAKGCGAEKICVVVGHKSEEVMREAGCEEVEFVLQEKQLGTGHAVMTAHNFIEENEDILVLYGDTPLITSKTLAGFIEFHKKENNGVSIISAFVADPEGYGRIIRDKNGMFVKNVEHKDADDEEKKVNEINTGIYCFKGICLKNSLKRITNNNTQNEYYLPDTLEIILKDGYKAGAMACEESEEFFGINTMAQLSSASDILKKRIIYKHMDNGVTFVDPGSVFIDDEVEIGADTVIYPGTILEGKTKIGQGCNIGPYTRLTNMDINNNVNIQFTTGIDSFIDDEAAIGPYAYIRPNSKIGKKVKIGDFVEIKNSNIGNETKVSHLTYVGDSDVGDGVNFGCGTVTVNYDGKNKYRTVIDDNVFIGCNTNFVAPVNVGRDSYIAAGSTITKDVPPNALAVARKKQKNIEGWIKK